MDKQNVLNLLNLAALIGLMYAAGLQVKFSELISMLQNKGRLAGAVIVNYLLIPLLAVFLLRAFEAGPLASTGFLILAVCPGAPVGPPLSKIAGANVPLSVALMLVLSVLSAVLSPLLLSFMLGQLLPDNDLKVDYFAMIRALLIGQLLPFLAGLITAQRVPDFAGKLAKPLDRISKALFLFVVLLITSSQIQAFTQVKPRGWLGMIVLFAASAMIGYFSGGREHAARISTSLTSATKNGGVALVITLGNFAGTPAAAAVIVYTVFSTLAALSIALICGRITQAKRRQ